MAWKSFWKIIVLCSLLVFFMGCMGSFKNSGGSISTDNDIAKIKVQQPDNSEKEATLNQSSRFYEIQHQQGDRVVREYPDGSKETYYPSQGAISFKRSLDVEASTGNSRENTVERFAAELASLQPLLWLGVGFIGLGVAIAIITSWKREGFLCILGGVVVVLIYKLALSPWFTIIGGAFLLLAIVTWYLEKKGYINASGYGEANEEVTKKRKAKRLKELQGKEEKIKKEL